MSSDKPQGFETLARDMIELIRASGPQGRKEAAGLDLEYRLDGAPMMGAINAMETLGILASPEFERLLRETGNGEGA
ncbi:hypothetical protein FAM22020_001287 [Propionibacterium freudenreichii]|uniref:hypothetical protein n=1 Tax=Propionibacterium freudenreichii TaxID=1744 RepID=UPI0005A5C7B6|nr:hypothetical protein [Propionibacterium freudenreichii]MDK9353616.1 hypothetical protein [Propionibacterium freudenreichii]CEI26487.1 Protein of unknown function [Propionibacterium freudenreichii]SBN43158.1 Hypothetical protein PFR_J18_820 [Propionibacterium freudenreichii]